MALQGGQAGNRLEADRAEPRVDLGRCAGPFLKGQPASGHAVGDAKLRRQLLPLAGTGVIIRIGMNLHKRTPGTVRDEFTLQVRPWRTRTEPVYPQAGREA